MEYRLRLPKEIGMPGHQVKSCWVEVDLPNGSKFSSTFFDISYVMRSCQTAGIQPPFELNEAQYFWRRDMILLEELSEKMIKKVVDDLLQTGQFEKAFIKYPVNIRKILSSAVSSPN